ncbi:LOW QUALITY PROTEIN: probable protein phosphatase 2C 62 [Argentina anserina]|uniref:LOW QUALITY PROTEIN: probable protein phosphatase 2C 62 n=1 Tax=Argentina anserina TaxID=57926 RepID=UPI0021765EB5|nr:LOW QUALITY PROTEIN: probable protein phosphatase 2C 62 [Potentilla anserina]
MGDPFLCLLKTHCFTFSSFSHVPSSTSRPFLHNNPRPRSPLRFPKPRPETTTLLPHSSSSSQFQLISTTECSDGSVVFRFGDESEKAAFDDEVRKRAEAELSGGLDGESNVEGSEVDASPASSPEEKNAVLDLTTVVLGGSSPSTNSQNVLTEGESHSEIVSGVSDTRKLEVQTLERSEGYLSTVSVDGLIEGEVHRIDFTGTSTPMPVEMHTSEVSEEYPSTKSEDELTGGKEDRTDVIGASIPMLLELHGYEGSDGYPSTKLEGELTEDKGDDVTGVDTPVELDTSESSKGYPSTRSEDEITEDKEHKRTHVTRASTPMPVELHTVEGSQGYSSTKSENESTQGKEDKTHVTAASTTRTIELHSVDGSEGYHSTKSEESKLSLMTEADLIGDHEFTEGKADQRDLSEALIDKTEELQNVEVGEENASLNSVNKFANDKAQTREASVELNPRIVELHSVEGAKEYPIRKSEDKSTEGQEQRDVSRASHPGTVELDTVESAKRYAPTKSEDKFAERKLDRINAATSRTVELHTVEHTEDISSKESEDEVTEGRAHRRNGLGASTPMVVELQTGEAMEGEEISAPLLLLSTGAASLPHPSKALTGGEDAYFVSFRNWLGVADGVSQWSLEGINRGLYAHELMENCEKFLSDCKGIPLRRPEDVLVRGAAQTNSPGSSTALVAYFDGQAFHVANIGNSGFIIIRNGAVFKRSSPLIHGFNFPLQIVRGVDPKELIERYSIDLDEGDVIVTATDGLFDNLYEQEITSIVIKSLQSRMKLKDIAKFLATSAQEVGQSTTRRSPFADAVETSGYVGYTGGKLDDVTVIVSHVQKKCSCYSQ